MFKKRLSQILDFSGRIPHNRSIDKQTKRQTMTTKAQQLKKELTQAFPELKFSVKTEKKRNYSSRLHFIYLIRVTMTGLIGSPYTKRQIEAIANKYENRAASTYVTIKNVDGDSLYEEIMRMVPDYKNNWETVHRIADNEFFSVLPDGYYEQKITQSDLKPIADEQKTENTIANQADPEYAIKSITIHWTEASNCTNKTFYSIADAITEIRSWYENDPQYLPTGGYYNKTEVKLTFGNKVREQNYTMRLLISQTEDNPFESENLFHTHFLEFWQEITACPDKRMRRNKSDLDFFLGCNWHRTIDTPIEYPQISLVDMVMAEIAIEEKYQEWIQDKLNLGQFDQIVTLETFKSTISPPAANLVFV